MGTCKQHDHASNDLNDHTRFRGLTVGPGKYEKLTIPEVVFSDPVWFYQALALPLFSGKRLLQAELVAQWCHHIRPGFADHFCIELSTRGKLKRITLDDRRDLRNTQPDGQFRTRHLDLQIVEQLHYLGDETGKRRVMKLVREHLFPEYLSQAAVPRRECEEFFASRDWTCAQSCRQNHLLPISDALSWR